MTTEKSVYEIGRRTLFRQALPGQPDGDKELALAGNVGKPP